MKILHLVVIMRYLKWLLPTLHIHIKFHSLAELQKSTQTSVLKAQVQFFIYLFTYLFFIEY